MKQYSTILPTGEFAEVTDFTPPKEIIIEDERLNSHGVRFVLTKTEEPDKYEFTHAECNNQDKKVVRVALNKIKTIEFSDITKNELITTNAYYTLYFPEELKTKTNNT